MVFTWHDKCICKATWEYRERRRIYELQIYVLFSTRLIFVKAECEEKVKEEFKKKKS